MKLKRSFLILIMGIMLFGVGCSRSNNKSNDKITVAVSIVPEETFVKSIAGELVNIVTLIPPGKSPESYAPTPKVLADLSDSKVYFSIGVPAEKAGILPKLKGMNNSIKIVNLAEAANKLYKPIKFPSGEIDPHIWMSPKRVKVMLTTIKDELVLLDPKNKDTYENNYKNYLTKLDTADKQIQTSLSHLKNKSFVIYHPCMGYFANDYNLNMIALEEEGKEASIKDLQKTIDYAKSNNIKVIFYQAEVDNKQAKVFADEINGKCEKIEPLSPDYIGNLNRISATFQKVLK